MRNILWLGTATLCLVVSVLGGNCQAPTSLPIGNDILDQWIVGNNPYTIMVVLQNTNDTGGLNTCGRSVRNVTVDSYYDLQSRIADTSSLVYRYMGSPLGSMRLKMTMSYNGQSLVLDTNLCLNPGVSDNAFRIMPTMPPVSFKIQGVTNAYAIFADGSRADIPLSDSGDIIFDRSLITATSIGRVRIGLTFDDGQTVIYTQTGHKITPPTVSIIWIPSPPYDSPDFLAWDEWFNRYEQYWWYGYSSPSLDSYNVFVTASLGADTVIESSPVLTSDPTSWTVVGGMSWDSWVMSTIIPFSTNGYPSLFFRARSY